MGASQPSSLVKSVKVSAKVSAQGHLDVPLFGHGSH